MKRAPAAQASRELESITSSLVQIRILHRVSAAFATAEQLQPLAHARLLASMTRNGLLRTKADPGVQPHSTRQYSLTPKGRRLLATATNHLRHFVAPPFTKHKENRKQS
jgi:hypothetical protein